MRIVPSIVALFIAGAGFSSSALAGAIYTASLSSAGESNPTSPGTGTAQVELDIIAHTLKIDVTFSGLAGLTTASHIHAPTALPLTGSAGVVTQTPTFADFPLGVSSGTYSHVFDTSLASTWNPSYLTASALTPLGAEAALAAALDQGRAYLNIHSSQYASGEIRGFLVPEPGSLAMIGVFAAGLLRRSRRVTQAV